LINPIWISRREERKEGGGRKQFRHGRKSRYTHHPISFTTTKHFGKHNSWVFLVAGSCRMSCPRVLAASTCQRARSTPTFFS